MKSIPLMLTCSEVTRTLLKVNLLSSNNVVIKTFPFDVWYLFLTSFNSAIYVEGPVELNCGETAHYKADIRIEESAFLSVSWEKVHGSARKQIDTSCEKYRGSTSRQLNIHSVCKEDEGEYQAVISRNLDHKIFSNIGFLQTQGGMFLVLTKDET